MVWCSLITFLLKSCKLYTWIQTATVGPLPTKRETLGCQKFVWVKGRFLQRLWGTHLILSLFRVQGERRLEGKADVLCIRYLVSAYISPQTKPTHTLAIPRWFCLGGLMGGLNPFLWHKFALHAVRDCGLVLLCNIKPHSPMGYIMHTALLKEVIKTIMSSATHSWWLSSSSSMT